MLERRHERLLLITLALIQFTNILDFMIMMPLGPQLMRVLGISTQQFSVIVSSYTLTAGLTGFLSSFVIDKFDRKRTLQLLYIGFILGTFACALSGHYYTLALARALTGAFGGVLGALVYSIVGDAIPQHRRGSAMGVVMTAYSAAQVLGVPIGLSLATWSNWNLPFFLLSFVAVGIQWMIWKYVPPMTAHQKQVSHGPLLQHIWHNPSCILALCITPTLMLGHFTLMPFLSPYMVSNVGLTEDHLTYMYLFSGFATIVTSPLAGYLSDRLGANQTFSLIALSALVPVWMVTHMGPTPAPLALIAAAALMTFASARMVPAMTLITTAIVPHHRGGFLSINSALQQLFAGISAYVGGFIVVKNSTGQIENFGFVSYIAVAATLVCILIVQKIKPLPSYRDDEVAEMLHD